MKFLFEASLPVLGILLVCGGGWFIEWWEHKKSSQGAGSSSPLLPSEGSRQKIREASRGGKWR